MLAWSNQADLSEIKVFYSGLFPTEHDLGDQKKAALNFILSNTDPLSQQTFSQSPPPPKQGPG